METRKEPGHGEKVAFELASISKTQVPVGTVVMHGGLLNEDWLAKQGWLVCDGRKLKMDKYDDLYKAIRGSFGQVGDEFNIPDCRGMFVRGVNSQQGKDPDADTRTAQGVNGNTGNNVGSVQGDALKEHTHFLTVDTSGSPKNWENKDSNISFWNNVGGNSHNPKTSVTGEKETRPVNIYLYFIIKFKHS